MNRGSYVLPWSKAQLVDVGFTHHEDVLLSWNPILVIIYNTAVAIEGKSEFEIAADLKNGHRSIGRRDLRQDLLFRGRAE